MNISVRDANMRLAYTLTSEFVIIAGTCLLCKADCYDWLYSLQ